MLQRGVIGFLALAAALGAGAANAATFTLTSGATAVPGGFRYTVGGITLTVTAGLFADNSVGAVTPGQLGAVPKIYSGGLGVSHSGDDSHTIDGKGQNDVLILAFNQDVRINSITFGYFDSKDDFDFFFDSDSNGVLNRVIRDVDIPSNGVAALATFFNFPGRWFGIGANGDNDSFKVKAVSVTPVPLPAGFALFLAGLAGLAFSAARRPRA